MGYTTSTVHGIEVPDSSESNDVPEDIGKVVTALEGGSIIRRLTGAAIAALTAPQKPAGLVVYNTTTNTLQVSDGSAFANFDAAPSHVIGIRSGNQTLSTVNGWNTITFTSEVDAGGSLNTGTGVFTVPTTGLWMLDGYANASATSLATHGYITGIEVNGTAVAADSAGWANTGLAHYMSVSAVVPLTAADTVTLRVYNSAEASDVVTYARLSAVLLGT